MEKYPQEIVRCAMMGIKRTGMAALGNAALKKCGIAPRKRGSSPIAPGLHAETGNLILTRNAMISTLSITMDARNVILILAINARIQLAI